MICEHGCDRSGLYVRDDRVDGGADSHCSERGLYTDKTELQLAKRIKKCLTCDARSP